MIIPWGWQLQTRRPSAGPARQHVRREDAAQTAETVFLPRAALTPIKWSRGAIQGYFPETGPRRRCYVRCIGWRVVQWSDQYRRHIWHCYRSDGQRRSMSCS